MNIVISPFARVGIDGQPSPKDYPYWSELISLIKERYDNVYLVQVGVEGEKDIGCHCFLKNLPFKVLSMLIRGCDVWISVDNFFHHLASHLNKPGIVIFGVSDPLVFGDERNINLLKDRKYLQNKFDNWSVKYKNDEAFIPPEVVIDALDKFMGR